MCRALQGCGEGKQADNFEGRVPGRAGEKRASREEEGGKMLLEEREEMAGPIREEGRMGGRSKGIWATVQR